MEEKGSEIGLENLNRVMVGEREFKVGRAHGQSAQVGRRMAWQMLIGRSGQPE